MVKKFKDKLNQLVTRFKVWLNKIEPMILLPVPTNSIRVELVVGDNEQFNNAMLPDNIKQELMRLQGLHIEGYFQMRKNGYLRDDIFWITDVEQVIQPDDYNFRYFDLKDIFFTSMSMFDSHHIKSGAGVSNSKCVQMCPFVVVNTKSELKEMRREYDEMLHKVNGPWGSPTNIVYKDNTLVRLVKIITGQK